MKKLELSTNLIGLDGTFCTYWGAGNTEYVLHEDLIEEDFKNGETDVHPDYYYSYFDNKSYMKDWEKVVRDAVAEVVEVALSKIDIEASVSGEGRYSPREYNFSHDSVDIDIEAESFDKLLEFCRTHEEFGSFLKDNYSSYDGFNSFTSNNVDEWEEDIKTDMATAWGAALSFLLDQEGVYGEMEEIKYEVFTDFFYSNYVDYTVLDEWLADLKQGGVIYDTSKEWQKALLERHIHSSKVLIDIVNRYYRTESIEFTSNKVIEELAIDDLDDISVVVAAVQKMYNDIDSQTLKLEL